MAIISYLDDKRVNIIKTFLARALDPYLIMVFGSAASGQMRPDSDIDLAVLSDGKFEPYQLFVVSQQLASLLECDIHLIELQKVSTVLQAQVVGKGKIILDRNPQRRQEFFIRVLKEYARLNEERMPILVKIKKRGTIYA